jgi:hypothetical protein
MNNVTLQELVMNIFLHNENFFGKLPEDYDYCIYNNHNFIPVEIDLDDIVETTECLLHIRAKTGNLKRLFKISELYSILNFQ